jgi:peptidyl-prolyl cis-trans isomerase C
MRWKALATTILVLGFQLITGCKNFQERPAARAEAPPAQRVLVRVNGEDLLTTDFERFVFLTSGELSKDPGSLPREELFIDFVTRRLVLQEARKAGIKVQPARIQQYTIEWTSKHPEELPGLSEHIHEFLTVQKFLSEKTRAQTEVSLSEIQTYYNDHSEEFVIEDQAHVLEILTRSRAEAERLREELKAGDVRLFKEMARKHSVGVTASSGGDLGFFCRGDLPIEFEKVIFSLKPGEISDAPFQSVHGYHIFLMEEWIPRHPQKFFEVQSQIFETLIAQKERHAVEAYLKEVLKNASVEVYDPSLEEMMGEYRPDENEEERE